MKIILIFVIVAIVAFGIFLSLPSSVDSFCPKLRERSRNLWNDQAYWTRQYILLFLDDLSGLENATEKLLKTHEDLTDFIDSLSGQKLDRSLLKTYIVQVMTIVKEKAEDKESIQKAYANADLLSSALAHTLDLSEKTMKDLLRTYLRLSLEELIGHTQQDTYKEQLAYTSMIRHIKELSDYCISNQKCKCPKENV